MNRNLRKLVRRKIHKWSIIHTVKGGSCESMYLSFLPVIKGLCHELLSEFFTGLKKLIFFAKHHSKL
jgi:hypothetical protein